MTKPPGTTAASAPGQPRSGPATTGDAAGPATTGDAAGPATTGDAAGPAAGGIAGTVILAVLAVAWLAAMLRSAQWAIASNGGTLAVTSTALSLPVVISASLVCGAAVSLVVINLLARRDIDRPGTRFAWAIGAGLLTGVAAASVVTLGYNDGGPAVRVLAGTIAAAAVIGGAVGGFRAPIAGGIVTAALTVFAVGFALSYFQSEVTSLYGAGDTPESQATALSRFSWTVSLVSGLAAGLAAFGYLRRATARRTMGTAADPHPLRWPGYLVAGAGPGLFLLLAEVLIWTAGARVLRLAGALSEADQVAQGILGASRGNHALVVLFLGAFTAMLAFGRTLRPAEGADTGSDLDHQDVAAAPPQFDQDRTEQHPDDPKPDDLADPDLDHLAGPAGRRDGSKPETGGPSR